MKFTKYALMAAGCALLASCSSEEPIVENGATNGTTSSGTATGYASFTINLPTAKGGFGRAYSYEDGNAQEYAVKNGKILIFQDGATEADATFICMGDLSGMSFNGNTETDEITTSSTSVAELTNINLSDPAIKYSAVVVLNYNRDTFVFPAVGAKFGDWSQTAQTGNMIYKDGGLEYFTMTNAPKVGGTAEQAAAPLTLVSINKDMIKPSESALNGSAATITVQRAVAKVTVETQEEYNVSGSSYAGDKVKISDWALDVTNKSGFPVQVTAGLDNASNFPAIWNTARFMGAANATFRRAFWAKDPNYDSPFADTNAAKQAFNVISSVSGKPAAAYCLENTFDIENMCQNQTTRVVFKGTYTPNSIPGYTAGSSFFKVGNSTQLWIQAGLEAEIKGKAKQILNADAEVSLGNVAAAAGTYSLEEVSIKVNGAETDKKNEIAQALGLKNATDKAISTYFNGEVYYIARIKHFGDDETPWNIDDPTYNKDNAKWLGRYGLVRNTVYVMNVNKISNPGYPVIPELKPDPDDENTYFIQVSVNVLAWAKRTNNVEL